MTRGGMLKHETDEAYPCPDPAPEVITWHEDDDMYMCRPEDLDAVEVH